MSTVLAQHDSRTSFFDSFFASPAYRNEESSPTNDRRKAGGGETLRIWTDKEELLTSPTSGASASTSASNAIPIPSSSSAFAAPVSPSLLSPSRVKHPKASSYAAGETIATSPALAFLSSFSSGSSLHNHMQNDSEGDVVSGYTLGPIIGRGAFSTIRQAYSSSGANVAVKIVKRADIEKGKDKAEERKKLDHERAMWSMLTHEHILPLFADHQTSYADYFITQYCPAGSLFDILKRDGRPDGGLPHDDARTLFQQIVRGLRYLHEDVGIAHRDIKLENVLVDEMGMCRIADFGMAKKIGELVDEDAVGGLEEIDETSSGSSNEDVPGTLHRSNSMHNPPIRRQTAGASKPTNLHLSLIRRAPRPRNASASASGPYSSPAKQVVQPGSLPYASPEILHTPAGTTATVQPAQDIWALGVSLFVMLCGKFPFQDTFEPRLVMKILHGSYAPPPYVGRHTERVLSCCLERDVNARWTIAQIDEVAWSVGWGSGSSESDELVEDENVVGSLLESESGGGPSGLTMLIERERSRSAAKEASRSRSRAPEDDLENEGEQDVVESPSKERARQRSTSRPHRSLSQGPASTNRSFSSSTSASYAPHAHTAAYARSTLSDHSLERGRRRVKRSSEDDENAVVQLHSTSRSPSPIPTTPRDGEGVGSDFIYSAPGVGIGGIASKLYEDSLKDDRDELGLPRLPDIDGLPPLGATGIL